MCCRACKMRDQRGSFGFGLCHSQYRYNPIERFLCSSKLGVVSLDCMTWCKLWGEGGLGGTDRRPCMQWKKEAT